MLFYLLYGLCSREKKSRTRLVFSGKGNIWDLSLICIKSTLPSREQQRDSLSWVRSTTVLLFKYTKLCQFNYSPFAVKPIIYLLESFTGENNTRFHILLMNREPPRFVAVTDSNFTVCRFKELNKLNNYNLPPGQQMVT